MREQQLLSRWRREAGGTVRRALAAARAWPERPPSGRSSLKSIILLVGLAATSRAAFAAGDTVTVNTLIDEDTPGDGRCSLREAIANINAQGDATKGDCATGLDSYTIDFSVSGTISIKLGVLSIGGVEPSLTINGGNSITVDGGGANQIFDVNTLVYLNDLTISNGFATNGGAASVAGALRVTNCSFVGNKTSGVGGAIYATGGAKLQFTDCVFDSNVAAEGGGAICNGAPQGELIVTTSAFSSNMATLLGGGAIYNDGSTAEIDSSTFQTNTAPGLGGAIYNTKSLTVKASTFSNNGKAVDTNGGAIGNGSGASTAITNSTFAGNLGFLGGATFNSGGQTEIHFCTFSGNSASLGGAIYDESSRPNGTAVGESILASSGSGGNCDAPAGHIFDGNYNISDDNTCGFVGLGAEGQTIGDGVDPKLDPEGLKDNGGATATIAEQSGSPSVDAVSTGVCANDSAAMHMDQRGEPRPDLEDPLPGPCDIGAYELQASPPPTNTPTATGTPSPSPTATPACVGDCSGSGGVSISDVITGVNIALGSLPVSACPAFENAQGKVDVAQLIKGVNNALNGCPH